MLVILGFLDAGTPGLTRNASLPGARLQRGATGVASTQTRAERRDTFGSRHFVYFSQKTSTLSSLYHVHFEDLRSPSGAFARSRTPSCPPTSYSHPIRRAALRVSGLLRPMTWLPRSSLERVTAQSLTSTVSNLQKLCAKQVKSFVAADEAPGFSLLACACENKYRLVL